LLSAELARGQFEWIAGATTRDGTYFGHLSEIFIFPVFLLGLTAAAAQPWEHP
jgi:hypothetical protein